MQVVLQRPKFCGKKIGSFLPCLHMLYNVRDSTYDVKSIDSYDAFLFIFLISKDSFLSLNSRFPSVMEIEVVIFRISSKNQKH